MKLFYSPYALTPLRQLNSLSKTRTVEGMYIRAESKNGEYAYADYFPHAALGDLSCAEIISGKRNEYFDKCLWFLENEKELRTLEQRPFQNHILANGDRFNPTHLKATYKVKILGIENLVHLSRWLEKDIRLRLDANGAVSFKNWQATIAGLNPEALAKIDYIEDPGEGDWRLLGAPSAVDFMESEYFDFEVYKPNRKFSLDAKKAVFSSYMGGDLGRYHCYLELLKDGNLSLVHGIDTPGIYEEQRNLFVSAGEGLTPDPVVIDDIYRDLQNRDWKCLN